MNPPDLCEHTSISQTEAKSKQPQAELEKTILKKPIFQRLTLKDFKVQLLKYNKDAPILK